MGSTFDLRVCFRRDHTPWALVSLTRFIRDAVWSVPHGEKASDHQVVLSACYRPDVATRIWYTLEWTSVDGERRCVSSQHFDLLLWRAAEVEMDVRERLKQEGKREQARVEQG